MQRVLEMDNGDDGTTVKIYLISFNHILWASLIAQLIKNSPAETLIQFLDREDPLEKGQATHSSILGLP